MLVATDAATQLMQITQPIAIGIIDKDRVGIGYVQTTFNNGGRQQLFRTCVIINRPTSFRFALDSTIADPDRRTSRARRRRTPRQRYPFQIRLSNKESCARFSSRMTAERISESSQRTTLVSTDRRSAGGVSRLLMSRTPTRTCRVRYRCGRQCHDIDVAVQRFESLFDCHAKTLLLVNHDQPQITEVNV